MVLLKVALRPAGRGRDMAIAPQFPTPARQSSMLLSLRVARSPNVLRALLQHNSPKAAIPAESIFGTLAMTMLSHSHSPKKKGAEAPFSVITTGASDASDAS